MVPEPPLVIPFLPNVDLEGPLPVAPVRIASWATTTTAGPSKRLAVAGTDNTVWILTTEIDAPQLLPDLSLSEAALRPPRSRHVSSASTSTVTGGRPRALSSTSSIMTSTSLRRVLSPTAASASLSSATVTAAAPDGHVPRASLSEHSDLMNQLREQVDRDDRPPSLGHAIAGHARAGVSGVQHKAEPRDDGSTSPKSVGSSESRGMSATLSGIMGRSSDSEASAKERRAKIDEMEVEQQMIREEAEDEREAVDMKIVEKAPPPQATPTPDALSPRRKTTQPPMRIVLPEPGRGSIIDLAVLEEVGELVILRDVGLLDVLNLSNLQLTKHVSLDHAAPPMAGKPGRVPKLAPSWLWQRVHLAAREEGALIIANGVPWPSPWPSPNGEVTRVAMLALPDHNCVANLELPGLGDVGVTSNGEASYLLHATPTSLMSYPIQFPQTPPNTRSTTPAPSHPGSANGSPRLLPNTGRKGALANVRSSSGGGPQQSGLARFLAARRTSSKKHDRDIIHSAAGVKQGVEVERDGGGHWFSLRLQDSGQGVGLGDGHVEMFDFDGKQLSVHGSIQVSQGTVKDASFSPSWKDVVVVTDGDAVLVFNHGGKSKNDEWSLRKQLSGHEACLGAGTLHVVEEEAICAVELGSMKRKVEVKTTGPVAGEHICPMGANKLFVASSESRD